MSKELIELARRGLDCGTEQEEKMVSDMADRIEELEKQRDELISALKRAREDINWMLNSEKFLNSFVFDYIDAAIASVKGGAA